MTEQDIIKAREFWGIYDYISDNAVKRFLGYLKTESYEWCIEYIRYMEISHKAW